MIIILTKIRSSGRIGNQFFIIILLFWIGVFVISADPTLLDTILESTDLQNRAQFLLIISTIIIIFLLITQFSKNKNLALNFNRLIRDIALSNFQREYLKAKQEIKLLIIIVAKNEARTIGNIIDKINSINLALPHQIIVVNDGSTDDTEIIVRNKGAWVINHIFNLGIGGATKTGFCACKIIDPSPQIIVSLDADGQHDPKYIPDIISKITEEKADLVYASRFSNKNEYQTSAIRRTGNKFYNKLVNRISNLSISDVTSGYRGIRYDKIDSIYFISETNFAIELALRAARNNLKIKEIPALALGRGFGESQFYRMENFFLYNTKAIKQIFNAYFRKPNLFNPVKKL